MGGFLTFLEKFLVIGFNILVVIGIILIFLYFRLDRMSMNAEMKWKAVNNLLRETVREAIEKGAIAPEYQETAKAFLKCRKISEQVKRACDLEGTVIARGADPELTRRCCVYNETAREFNEKCKKDLWRTIAWIFRMKECKTVCTF